VLAAHARYLYPLSPGGHKLAILALIHVLVAAFFSLGVFIVRAWSAHLVAEFNSDRRTAVRAVQVSFLFANQSPGSSCLSIRSRIYEAQFSSFDASRFATYEEAHCFAIDYANVFEIESDVAAVALGFKEFP
jgi:hypothetical protein